MKVIHRQRPERRVELQAANAHHQRRFVTKINGHQYLLKQGDGKLL